MSDADEQKPNAENNLGKKVAGGAIGGAVGGLVGSLAGFAVAGPMGALGGSILGNSVGNASAPLIEHAFQRVSAEFMQRQLSQREERRIVSVLDYVADKVTANFASGLKVRQDSFFSDDEHDRSAADEIFEGVLLAAQREYQEKKIPYYGTLFANIAFHPEISRAQANLLIRLAEQLSYRQLCVLQIFATNTLYGIEGHTKTSRFTSYSSYRQEIPSPYWSLLSEIYELYTQGYLRYSFSIKEALLYPLDLDLNYLHPTDLTNNLRKLMELDRLDNDDLSEILTIISDPPQND